jgi:hypothetical protein
VRDINRELVTGATAFARSTGKQVASTRTSSRYNKTIEAFRDDLRKAVRAGGGVAVSVGGDQRQIPTSASSG